MSPKPQSTKAPAAAKSSAKTLKKEEDARLAGLKSLGSKIEEGGMPVDAGGQVAEATQEVPADSRVGQGASAGSGEGSHAGAPSAPGAQDKDFGLGPDGEDQADDEEAGEELTGKAKQSAQRNMLTQLGARNATPEMKTLLKEYKATSLYPFSLSLSPPGYSVSTQISVCDD